MGVGLSGLTQGRKPSQVFAEAIKMSPDDFDLLIVTANKRLGVYLEYRERLIGDTSPFFRSLLAQNEWRIRGCEFWLNELHSRRVDGMPCE